MSVASLPACHEIKKFAGTMVQQVQFRVCWDRDWSQPVLAFEIRKQPLIGRLRGEARPLRPIGIFRKCQDPANSGTREPAFFTGRSYGHWLGVLVIIAWKSADQQTS